MFHIGIEDLAANAFIALLQEDEKCNFITYDELELYGEQAVKVLAEKGEKATLLLSRNHTDAIFRDCSDFFEEEKQGIRLKADKNRKSLIDRFRGYLPIDVLLALMDERSVKILGISL
jgi:hypothetical protein